MNNMKINGKWFLVKEEDSDGYWEKYSYDEKGNMIKAKDFTGFYIIYRSNAQGNVVFEEDCLGRWRKYFYEYMDLI